MHKLLTGGAKKYRSRSSRRPRKRAVVTRGLKRRKASSRVAKAKRFRSSIRLYHKNKLQKRYWVTLSPNLLHIVRDRTRVYWSLKLIPKYKRPKVKVNDLEKTLTIAGNKIVFKKPVEYRYAKNILWKWSRKK
jgi:hypothetical protein